MAYTRKEFHKEEKCLNCDYPLIGRFCGNCGQKAFLHKHSFWHMAMHFVGDYFHYDNKFWVTFRTLFTRPGLATLEFNEGKRSKYLNPAQLYFFVTTVFFLIALGGSADKQQAYKIKVRDSVAAQGKLRDSVTKTTTPQADTSENPGRSTIGLVSRNGKLLVGLGELTPVAKSVEAYDSLQQSLPPGERDGYILRHLRLKSFEHAKGLDEQLSRNFPKVFFILLPVFALILALLFRKNKMFYVDHLIFGIHFHVLLFLLMLFNVLLQRLWDNSYFNNAISILTICGLFIYLYFSLRRVYHATPIKTMLKMLLLTFIYLFNFLLAFVILIFVLFAFF